MTKKMSSVTRSFMLGVLVSSILWAISFFLWQFADEGRKLANKATNPSNALATYVNPDSVIHRLQPILKDGHGECN